MLFAFADFGCDRDYLCRDCIAKYLGWTSETLDEWILKFRENGCMLFPPLSGGDESL